MTAAKRARNVNGCVMSGGNLISLFHPRIYDACRPSPVKGNGTAPLRDLEDVLPVESDRNRGPFPHAGTP